MAESQENKLDHDMSGKDSILSLSLFRSLSHSSVSQSDTS